MKRISIAALMTALFSGSLYASAIQNDMLVKIAPDAKSNAISQFSSRLPKGTLVEDLGIAGWVHVRLPRIETKAASAFTLNTIQSQPGVLAVTPNHAIFLYENFALKNPADRQALLARIQQDGGSSPMLGDAPAADNPEIPGSGSGGSGADPLTNKQWGMNQNRVKDSWSKTKGRSDVVVAVIDTGVDYTHEDLVDNMWRNPREIAGNNVDDDGNGFIDDIVGWDFAANDNKPYDLTASMMDMLLSGGNPGHGTHCAGNVAARSDNGKGITGVAPGVRIMALRFITEKGQGTTDAAVKAIKYAVDNGAKVLSNSWGSEGGINDNDAESVALRDAINYAKDRGVLFIAAAGNGRNGAGFDNDRDAKPAVPASYPMDNIISVAAIDEAGALGAFSNWGATTVDIGAPGVKVFSTVTQSEKYSDTVIDIPGLITATWDGTSMATPHVAGAAALYISLHPEKSWSEVKAAIMGSAKRTSTLQGKVVSGGQLDVFSMSQF